jgi:hypothetical protein
MMPKSKVEFKKNSNNYSNVFELNNQFNGLSIDCLFWEQFLQGSAQ